MFEEEGMYYKTSY